MLKENMESVLREISDACKPGNEYTLNELLNRYRNAAKEFKHVDGQHLLPIHIAAFNDNPNICEQIIAFDPTSINVKSPLNLTALQIASHFGRGENVKLLLSRKDIDVNARDIEGDTALHHSAGKRHFQTYAILAKDRRCDTKIRNSSGKSAEDDLAYFLKDYTLHKSKEDFISLAACLTSFNIVDKEGNTPLHWSCSSARDDYDKSLYLIKKTNSKFVNIPNKHGDTPAHIAANKNHLKYVSYIETHHHYLLEIRNKQGKTVYEMIPGFNKLYIICRMGKASDIECMLKKWAKYLTELPVEQCLNIVRASHAEKLEKLNVFVCYYPKLVELFLDQDDHSFILLAALEKNIPILKMLIDKFPSMINKRDRTGKTAWDYVTLKEYSHVLKVFETHAMFKQSAVGLINLSQRKFSQSMRVEVLDGGWSLHLIQGELWYFTGKTITIFSPELVKQREISCGDNHIWNVADIGDCVVVGTWNGLYLLRHSGEPINKISGDNIRDVRFHSDQLLCVSGEPGKGNVVIKWYNPYTWQIVKEIQSPCDCKYYYRHTLHVGSEHITLACFGTEAIYTMSRISKQLEHKSQPGQFDSPRLFHMGSDTVFASDPIKDTLQVQLHGGEWKPVGLEPKPCRPHDMVYFGGAFYVLAYPNNKSTIHKYDLENSN